MAVKTWTSGEVLTAADQNTYAGNPGLVWVASGSFSAITAGSPLTVSSVFGSTMDNYRIILECTTSGPATLVMQLRNAGGAIAGSLYGNQKIEYYNVTIATSVTTTATSWSLGYNYGESKRSFIILDLLSPNRAVETTGTYAASIHRVANTPQFLYSFQGTLDYNATTQATGFSFWPDGNNATGNYWVYGYRQS